jgi:hypothetical protein
MAWPKWSSWKTRIRARRCCSKQAYTLGRRCRRLVPGDLLHFLVNPDRGQLDPPFFDFNDATMVYDGFYAEDMRATLGVLLSTGHYLFNADLWRMLLRRARSAPAPAPAASVARPLSGLRRAPALSMEA